MTKTRPRPVLRTRAFNSKSFKTIFLSERDNNGERKEE